MRTDDKRKGTSRLNALKSTGPKTPEGKRRSAFNSTTHGAYARNLMLPGEKLTEFEELIKVHLDTWKPTNLIEDILVTEMTSTLWRLRRQAPAEASLIDIHPAALTTKPVETNLTADEQTANQTMENESSEIERPERMPVGTNLTEDHKTPNQSTESTVGRKKPVETKLLRQHEDGVSPSWGAVKLGDSKSNLHVFLMFLTLVLSSFNRTLRWATFFTHTLGV